MGACNSSQSQGSSISAETEISSIHQSLKQHIEEKKTADTQKSFSVQNLKITYDYDPNILTMPPYNAIIEKYWPWGTKQKTCGPAYGCSYDVSQKSEVTLKTVDKDKIANKSEIYNAIKQHMSKKSEDTLTGQESIKKNIDSKNLSKSVVEDNIEKAVERFKDTYNEEGEIIELVVNVPLKCPDPCTEEGNVVPLNQEVIVDNLINNITNETLNSVRKQSDNIKSKTKSSTNDTNYGCIFQMLGSCLCILLILIVVITKPWEADE